MTDQLAFILAPSTSTNLQQSQSLNFLPFALGPSSDPYASTSAPTSTYFQPRPCPPNHPSLKEGTPIAAFRGRQLVGQSLEVPKGYKGVILRAGARPDRGGITEIRGKAREGKWPLTPATSVASTSSAATAVTETDEAGGVRRSPRKPRGAGQVALSKPRQTFKRGLRKRLRLDSDSEEEPASVPSTTPKRQRHNTQITPAKPPPLELPEIKVQSPTPRKHLPEDEGFGLRRLRGPTGMEESDPYGGIEVEEVEDVKTQVIDESVVPSPATEDLPPLFTVESKMDISDDSKPTIISGFGVDGSVGLTKEKPTTTNAEEVSTDSDFVRQLRPMSSFDSITLWTADVPLVGFRQDEMLERAEQTPVSGTISSGLGAPETADVSASGATEEKGDGETDAKNPTDGTETDGQSTDVNAGWWRVGGSGEGGDEFVRGMGEWLGLVHMINEPIYLRDLPKEDEEDEI